MDRGRPAELLRLAAARGRMEEEAWRVRKDGSRFWADVVLSAIRDDTGQLTGYAKVTRDFTDRKRAEEAVMLQLSTALMANLDIGKLLTAISASIHEVVPHDRAALALYDAATGDFSVQSLGPEDPESMARDGRASLQGTVSGRVFSSGEPIVLQRPSDAAESPSTVDALARMGMQSGCWVPLVHHGKTIGVLGVLSRIEGGISAEDVHILERIAVQVAMAVDHTLAFQRIAELRDQLRQQKQYLEEEINLENRYEDIVGDSKGLRQVLQQIETVAPTTATVLIQGETGTGKELLARAIHRLSPRRERTFIKLNCAAIPAGLLESELFGHEKGAFTGAIARKMGRLELAHEGTLFLDEVGEMPLDLQPKLLRALQEREIERLGGTRPISVDVRLIAATNRDLAQMVAEKQFRSDLYYRLKVFPIFSPPLRDRASDIPELVRHFVATHSRRMGKAIESIPPDTMRALCRWPWPGNIRELENFIERAVILTRGPELFVPVAELEAVPAYETEIPESATLHEAEREHVLRVLKDCKGQIGGEDGAAARLGLKRTTLNSKLKKLRIERSDYI
jgi:transcriptional regulator with GAF, ATPase, and Fis domain